ncbi:AraC family transcriptional regulator [Opitutus sp. ER46]|uniref:helix-turn-helix transcriptional regulator n=1 Tax=Opitutus sp. ER46 TaxID=2161864 RepID=UPI001304B30B|nr:AraC family transcriptional regulator [Opitutus sp. ER46]
MATKRELMQLITAAAEALEIPRNYYHGRRRWPSELPDNVLVFLRSAAGNLSPHTDADFHHRWVLLVALAGRGTVRIDRQICELRPGQALLIPPLHLHDYPKLAAPAIRWLFVTFEWPAHTAQSTCWRRVRTLEHDALASLEGLMALWRRGPSHGGTLLAAHLMDLLMSIYSTESAVPAAAPAPPAAVRLLDAVQRQLRQSAPGPLRVVELARRLGTCESHLRARFRAEAGISLGRYLRQSRVRAAALILREERIPVKAVAERLGFNDIYAFSRAFKHVIGLPPSQFRKADSR